MPNRGDILQIQTFTVDMESIALALHVNLNTVFHRLSDGRIASAWTEEWASKIYNLKTAESACPRGYDLYSVDGAKTEVKTLTSNGVKFQRSARIGTGRKCTNKELMKDIGRVEGFILVDITNLPIIKVIRVSSGFIQGLGINQNGLTKEKFYTALGEPNEEGKATRQIEEIPVKF